jgi:hypothetical protein
MRKVIEVDKVEEVVEEGIPSEAPPLPPTMNPMAKTVLIVIASLTIAFVLYFLVKKIIQLIRWLIGKASDTLTGGKRIKRDTENEEFEEIVEFTKDKARRKRQKTIRYKYSLRELKNLDTYKEKVRYLYGFALERLKYKNVKISKADTPEEIVDKLGTYENGNKLVDNVFKDFTDEYINVRYGDKETGQDEDFMEKADAVDKGIENIKVKDEKATA